MDLRDILSPELFDQVQAAIDAKNAGETDKTKHVRFADLSEGRYVSVDKYNSNINGLNQQVKALQDQITQRDTDMNQLKETLSEAQANEQKLVDAQSALNGLQQKYQQAQQEWDEKIKKQNYEFMVRERANTLNFSSNAAKRDFIREANGKGLQVDGNTLLGYDDFLAKYKEANPGALVEENPEDKKDPTPKIVAPKSQPNPEDNKSLFGFNFHGVRPKPEN